MSAKPSAVNFGIAWLGLCGSFIAHVIDEALTDFLSFYNPAVAALKERMPFFPMPTFTFQVWLTMLVMANAVLLLLSVFAFRGARWMRPLSFAFAGIMFLNGLLHLTGSLFLGRILPGVYSAPLLLLASSFLILRARQID
jgi:hypothetical protein